DINLTKESVRTLYTNYTYTPNHRHFHCALSVGKITREKDGESLNRNTLYTPTMALVSICHHGMTYAAGRYLHNRRVATRDAHRRVIDSPCKASYFIRIQSSTLGVEIQKMKFFILMMSLGGALCYLPPGKDSILSGIFLRDLLARIRGDGGGDGVSYVDFTDGLPALDAAGLFPADYDTAGRGEALGDRLQPALRDREYLRHGSLWGNQFISGGSGEGNQLLRPDEGMKNNHEIKTDSTLPAYCNPPNPCPVGYSEDQGCIEEFENSASFSRRYQAAQDCMCDTEHMFECPNPGSMSEGDSMDLMDDFGFNNMLQQTLKLDQVYPHKNLVAKKFHSYKSEKTNPFLMGEKLPVAAKKGIHVPF
ncbi:unnamed protein product, partial [Phaedon cochleariae]